ncbi:hypothetical protein evm_007734 [Chilo suppressalis]|nr:hypothetical protein evm_007734 [Chilo suppressalis]
MDSEARKSEYIVQDESCENGYWFISYYAQNGEGNTRLHEYIIHTPVYDDLAKIFIGVTWPVSLLNIQNTDGKTALHLAAMGSQSGINRQLIYLGS